MERDTTRLVPPRNATMSLKVSAVHLGLDEPEDVLPARLADRLGVGVDAIGRWRILRKSLDARRHGEIHFVYSAEVELPADEYGLTARGLGPGVERFAAERFDWPESPGSAPLPSRPVIVGA